MIGNKFTQFLVKVAKTVAEPKLSQNITFKAQFESSKQLHETSFKTYIIPTSINN
jgi:hypothetical protein